MHTSILTLLLLTATAPAGRANVTSDCMQHVASLDSGREVSARCGEAMELPKGAAVSWTEDSGRISRASLQLPASNAVVAPELVRAATVSVRTEQPLRANEHLLLVVAAAEGPFFVRPVAAERASQPLRVPEGRLLAMVIDDRGDVTALSRPVAVAGEVTVAVSAPAAPALVAFVDRPEKDDGDALSLSLGSGDGARRPDVSLDSRTGTIAMWWSPAATDARLIVDSKSLRLPNDAIAIGRRGITTIRRRLEPLPTLTVSIDAPPESVPRDELPPLTLALFQSRDAKPFMRHDRVVAGESVEFAHVPAAPLAVMLEIGAFKTGARVDLSNGQDTSVHIPLHAVPLSGTVFFGDQPARAEVRFLQTGEPVKTATDERGRYALTLWEERRYFVDVQLLDHAEVPPYQDVFSVAANDTLDIHVPAIRFAARVFDRATKQPVPKATVVVRNTWTSESGRHSSVRSFPSDAAPLIELPPQRPGTSELRVTAPEYLNAEPVVIEIDPSLRERVVDIAMQRAGETQSLTFALPDGSAAAGADIAVTPDGNEIVWQASADANGRVAMPVKFASMSLLARHATAGSVAVRQHSPDDVIALAPAAPPLTVTAAVSDGSPAGNAIFAWIGGLRLTGPALAFVTRSSPMTDARQQWIARGLPAAAIRVLAVRPNRLRDAMGGGLDAVAEVIPYPWPAAPSLHAIE